MKLSDLKALFWKEWHENLRWSILALLALSVGLAYAEYRQLDQNALVMLSQVWSSANLVLTLAAPLIGLILGLLQILPELRRDQWAFLVHRPVSRTTLFFGKVIPGVCLYGLATIPPLLGFALWASFPSHVPAPFDLRFTLAGWAAICSGLPFYFAGLLVALRPARWYGSRALPIVAALAGPFVPNLFSEFWQFVLVCVAIVGVLFAAAWGSFVTGDYKAQSKPARFALGLTLYPGVAAVAVAVMMLFFGAYSLLSKPTGSNGEWWRTNYQIDAQGRIFETAEHGMDSAHQERKTLTITDLAGHTVDPHMWGSLNRQHKLLDMNFLNVRPGAENYMPSLQQTERYVSLISSDYSEGQGQAENWYYDSRSRQIVQYTVHLLGSRFTTAKYLGPKGFSEDSRQAGQFPDGMMMGYTSYFAGLKILQFPHALFWYDLSRPAVGLLQTAPGPVGVLGTSASQDPTSNADTSGVYFVAADGQVTVYDRPNREAAPESTRRLFTTPLAFHDANAVQVAMTPDLSRFFFWYQNWEPSKTDHVVTVAANGRIINDQTLPATHGLYIQPSLRFVQTAPAVMVPPVGICVATLYGYIGHALKNEAAESWWRVFGNGRLFFAALFFSTLGGLVAAVLGWLISRRCGDTRREQIAWAFGIFWLGGYGVLLLLALRAWPARVPCPNCGRLRVVDRTECEHCGAQFARPQRDGTEIFDEVEGAGVG